MLRVDARAHPETVARASAISAWLTTERAPLATPDRRWDRLLYPIHDVETYLRARTPRELLAPPPPSLPSPLPRTGPCSTDAIPRPPPPPPPSSAGFPPRKRRRRRTNP